ncbi:hypothetical protein BH11BAC5_BH11BAC5_26840 [soil metagenome]
MLCRRLMKIRAGSFVQKTPFISKQRCDYLIENVLFISCALGAISFSAAPVAGVHTAPAAVEGF